MEIILRTFVIYFVLLFMLRVTTRRLMRSTTPLDIAVVFLFGGIALQAILGEDHSIISSVLAIGTISFIHISIAALKRHWPFLGMITEGTPIIIYKEGTWNDRRMKDPRIQTHDVLAEVRQRGLRNMDQVEFVTVEHNGAISILQKRGIHT